MSTCTALLQSTHDLISRLRGEPHWRLADPDAKLYGQALANATRHMAIAVAQKYIDYYNLGMTIVMIETPRIVMSQQLKTRPQRPPQPFGQVFQFTRPPTPQPSPQAAPPPNSPETPPADHGPGFVEDGVDAPIGGV